MPVEVPKTEEGRPQPNGIKRKMGWISREIGDQDGGGYQRGAHRILSGICFKPECGTNHPSAIQRGSPDARAVRETLNVMIFLRLEDPYFMRLGHSSSNEGDPGFGRCWVSCLTGMAAIFCPPEKRAAKPARQLAAAMTTLVNPSSTSGGCFQQHPSDVSHFRNPPVAFRASPRRDMFLRIQLEYGRREGVRYPSGIRAGAPRRNGETGGSHRREGGQCG